RQLLADRHVVDDPDEGPGAAVVDDDRAVVDAPGRAGIVVGSLPAAGVLGLLPRLVAGQGVDVVVDGGRRLGGVVDDGDGHRHVLREASGHPRVLLDADVDRGRIGGSGDGPDGQYGQEATHQGGTDTSPH